MCIMEPRVITSHSQKQYIVNLHAKSYLVMDPRPKMGHFLVVVQ